MIDIVFFLKDIFIKVDKLYYVKYINIENFDNISPVKKNVLSIKLQ